MYLAATDRSACAATGRLNGLRSAAGVFTGVRAASAILADAIAAVLSPLPGPVYSAGGASGKGELALFALHAAAHHLDNDLRIRVGHDQADPAFGQLVQHGLENHNGR